MEKMSDEKKKLIEQTVENLKHLDRESLLIMRSGAEMLKSRDDIEKYVAIEDGTKAAG